VTKFLVAEAKKMICVNKCSF